MTQVILYLAGLVLSGVIITLITLAILDVFKFKRNWKLDLAIAMSALIQLIICFALIFVGVKPSWGMWGINWLVVVWFVDTVGWFVAAWLDKNVVDRNKAMEKKE